MTEAGDMPEEVGRRRRKRSTLPTDDARTRYLEMGALAALEQIRDDAQVLGNGAMAIGPFARLDAAAVAARDGKTRGAITNLFGSQAVFQARTMDMVLDAAEISEAVDWPEPSAYTTPGAWVTAFFASQSARGPRHGAEPATSYATLWALWLGVVPYGLWSEHVAGPSMEEYSRRVAQFETVFAGAVAHFSLALREGATIADLACGAVSLIEGVWLNQCLANAHPRDRAAPISEALVRAGRMLWCGAIADAGTRPADE
ncbi:MAG: hypothetical protein U1E59_21275 [Amaricoccus sp.]